MNPDTNLNQTYTVEYNSNLSRNASKDYGVQPVTPPAAPRNLSNIVISTIDLSGQTLSAGYSADYQNLKFKFLEDSGIRVYNIKTSGVNYDTDGNSTLETLSGEGYDYNTPVMKVYRTKSDGSRVLELVGELDYLSVDEESSDRNLELQYKTVGNSKAFVIKDSRVPELENMIIFSGESRKKNVAINSAVTINGVYQGGKLLNSVGSTEHGRVYSFDTLLPVNVHIVNNEDNIFVKDANNQDVDTTIYYEDSVRNNANKYMIFYKADSLPVIGIKFDKG